VTKKTAGAKRNAPLPDAIDDLVESLSNKPKHASDFSQEVAAEIANPLEDNERIGRQHRLAGRPALVCISHILRERPPVQDAEKGKFKAEGLQG